MSKHGKLDIMFKNAGIIDDPKSRIIDNEKADFERVLDINAPGVFLGTKLAARVMIPARFGSITSTASICSYLGAVASHAYTASKHAVVGLTKNAAAELGQFGVSVNCVSPYGLVTPVATRNFAKTQEEDLERAFSAPANLKWVNLKVDDVAQAVLYLGRDASNYVSDHNLLIDGGFSVSNHSFHKFHYSSA